MAPGIKLSDGTKARASGTDSVCVELEDGLAPKDKAEARGKAMTPGSTASSL